jgi:pimeloyl-ACP methyl ester carboxylesterase
MSFVADGFILRVFRIPGLKTNSAGPAYITHHSSSLKRSTMHTNIMEACEAPSASSGSLQPGQRPVVFLQHALMDSSAGWLILGSGKSLALQLVDAGFDVWLGNARGNRYSRNHTTLQPDQPAFWAWSWQQQAEYDLPASIGLVLQATQQQKLVYVGYSQVCMQTACPCCCSAARLAQPLGNILSLHAPVSAAGAWAGACARL